MTYIGTVFDFVCLLIFEVHARRLQALKALTYAPPSSTDILSKLYEIVFGILDKVCASFYRFINDLRFFYCFHAPLLIKNDVWTKERLFLLVC